MCIACTEALHCRRTTPDLPQQSHTCSWCNTLKSGDNFADQDDDEDNWCRQCELQRQFRTMPCKICHKHIACSKFARKAQQIYREDDTDTFPTCDKCQPRPTKFTCMVCQKRKERNAFHSLGRLASCRFHLRCKTCCECQVCGVVHKDARHLVPDKQLCTKCALHKCHVCKQSKTSALFDEMQLRNRGDPERKLRCKSCQICSMCKIPKPLKDF